MPVNQANVVKQNGALVKTPICVFVCLKMVCVAIRASCGLANGQTILATMATTLSCQWVRACQMALVAQCTTDDG